MAGHGLVRHGLAWSHSGDKSIGWAFMKKQKMVEHKLKDLILDMSIYPREKIDPDHVARLVRSLEAGAVVPPIIVCQKSKRIADGAHRYKAFIQMLGLGGLIKCIEKVYKTEQEFFLEGIRYNAGHGLVLSEADRERVKRLGHKLEIDPALTNAALTLAVDASAQITMWQSANAPITVARRGASAKSSSAGEQDRKVTQSATGWVLTDEQGKKTAFHIAGLQVVPGLSDASLMVPDMLSLANWLIERSRGVAGGKKK